MGIARRPSPRGRRLPARELGERSDDLRGRVEEHVVEPVVDEPLATAIRHHRQSVVVHHEPHALGEHRSERLGELPGDVALSPSGPLSRGEEVELAGGGRRARHGFRAHPIERPAGQSERRRLVGR